jgi:hypothetical protein
VLDVLFRGPKASPVAWRPSEKLNAIFDPKNIDYFSAVTFFQFLVIKILDLELDPDSH